MTDPVAMALLGEALKNPKDVGEGVSAAATGIGTGVSTASTGIGAGVGTAATGIGSGFRESKIGDAAVEEAKGNARAKHAEALGTADARRIEALATLAEKIKDLPPDAQRMILDKAAATQPEPEAAPQTSPLSVAATCITPFPLLLAQNLVHANGTPGTHITGQQNHGACRQAPVQQQGIGK